MFAFIGALLLVAGHINEAFAAEGTIDLFNGKPCTLCHPSKVSGPGLHGALEGNRCTPCHKISNGNHQIDHRYSEVKDRTSRLCYECHNDQYREKSVHPPILDNDCLGCHTPHSSAHGNLLKAPLGHLCFQCHKRALVDDEKTVVATGFRDGNINLHYLHARKHALACLACHHAHSGSQDHLIRAVGGSGSSKVTLTYQAAPTGGSCTTSCHDGAGYVRK